VVLATQNQPLKKTKPKPTNQPKKPHTTTTAKKTKTKQKNNQKDPNKLTDFFK